MNVEQIPNIEDLIRLPSGHQILWHEVKRLTAPGENYGSLILSVDLTVKTRKGTEKVYTVAKLIPPNDFIQQIFNTPVTFRNEIAFYKNVIPALQDFQREHGVAKVIDFAPKCYGGRLNIKGGDQVDKDAVLALENLRISNYITLERMEGLGLETAKLVIVNLARFHAVPLALKFQRPEVFEKEVKKYLAPWPVSEEQNNNMKRNVIRVIDEIPGLEPLKDRILAGFDNQVVEHEPREPFATVTHNDCWTNNSMFRFDGSTPIKSILVDYQVCGYGSPAGDLVFFIFSSVRNHVIEESYDELLELYHQTFISTLQQLKCSTEEFTFEALQKEIDFEARHSQVAHVSFMLFPIYAKRDNVKEISEITPDNIIVHDISDVHKEKFAFVVKEFAKRKWI